MPCPMCLLGYSEPHTKEDWALLYLLPALRDRLEVILDDLLNDNDYWSDDGTDRD